MTLDLGLQLDPDGANGIRLTVVEGASRKVLLRGLPDLDPIQLDALRLGDSLEPMAGPLAKAISGWFLGSDLTKRLKKALAGQSVFRFVVRMHPDLVPVLGDLPVEIVSLPSAPIPLVLHPRVHSMIRVPPIVSADPVVGVPRDWPFSILFVRTNPADLGGAVPPLGPIVEAIQQAAKERGLPDGAVRVETISSEPGIEKPATWDEFRKALGAGTYDVLAYLGHGDLTVIPGTPPIGKLQFEEANGHRSVDAAAIVAELAQHPVRVVLLAGCLTAASAADDAETKEKRVELDKRLPEYLKGSQGVAQAVVADAPVELAVGMRDLLEVSSATTLLGSFFRNLIKDHPGDVELAIREARSDLFGSSRFPPSWSSAIVFAKGAPPFFDFIADKPVQAAFLAERQKEFDTLRNLRQTAETQFLLPVGDRTPSLEALRLVGGLEKLLLKGDTMIRPTFVESAKGAVKVQVELVGSVATKRITGKVSINGDGVVIDKLVADPRIKLANFLFLHNVDGAKAFFSIDSDGPNALPLAAGPLITIEATVTSEAPAIHEVVVTRAASDPEIVMWSGMDVIAVTS